MGDGAIPDLTPRWRRRFDNYRRAFVLLREAIETRSQRTLSQLEQEGVIQRFEYTWELAWKVQKDVLEADGIVLDSITPASVIRAAFAAGLIDRGQDWMAALDARNKMAHTYNFKTFEAVIVDVQSTYLSLFDGLHETLLARALGDD
jgi:nucleotidyltransferase substrate binding protein (TIGR01987 family)